MSADPSSSVRHGEVDRVPGAWFGVAAAAGLVSPTGQIATTIFAEMSALAARTGAINLGQGFPDEDGPAEVLEAAQRAIRDGVNQYPPGRGIPELLQAIAEHQHRFYGLEIDPAREALVTVGATEALTATLVALLSPGDEVIVFEPYYDSYAAAIALASEKRSPIATVDSGALASALAAASAVPTRCSSCSHSNPEPTATSAMPRRSAMRADAASA